MSGYLVIRNEDLAPEEAEALKRMALRRGISMQQMAIDILTKKARQIMKSSPTPREEVAQS